MTTTQKNSRRFFKLAKEPLLSSRVRGNPENRIWAKALDFALIQALAFVLGYFWVALHWVVPAILWPAFERMGRGQSPGKWLLGLHVIEGNLGRKPNFFQCFVRNLPVIFLSLGMGGRGWLQGLFFIVGLPWCLLESYFIFRLRSGLRIADVFAHTRVFDFKDEHTQFIEQFLREPENVS